MMRKMLGVIEMDLSAFAGPHFRLVLDNELAGMRADFIEVRRRWDGMSSEMRDEFSAAVLTGTCAEFWHAHADLWPETVSYGSTRPDAHLGAVEGE